MTSILNRRKALLGGAAAVAALAMPAVVAAESSPDPVLQAIEPAAPDAELAMFGAEFDRLCAALDETNALLEPTDEEAERLRDEKPAAMKFTGQDYLWFGKVNGPGNQEWLISYIDKLGPYIPLHEWDNPAPKNARIAELKAARDAWARRNLEFSIRTGRQPLVQRLDDLYGELDRVERRIIDQPAASVTGLIVKAKAAKREGTLWSTPVKDLDYDQQFLRDLVENLLALATVPA